MADQALPLQVAARYSRSVHIMRDFTARASGLHEYHVTPLVLQCIERITDGLRDGQTDRAFSIIGPYGSGKSAFGVFLAHYLQRTPTQRRSLLKTQGIDQLPAHFTGDGSVLLPVLVSGNNGVLRPAILQALGNAIQNTSELKSIHSSVAALLDDAVRAVELDPQFIADTVAQVNKLVCSLGQYQGIVLMIDELGQYLNYTVQRGDERDLFVLQTLAEMASRSGSTPFVIITILHQSFDRYTLSTGGSQRTEWAKVQGRFTELPFLEPSTQMLRLIARALNPDYQSIPARQHTWGEQAARTASELGLRPSDMDEREWRRVVTQSYPLHPMVLIALPFIFRQLAQNERSLFAFLTTQEAGGLQDFYQSIRHVNVDQAIYRLHDLYNYVELTLGTSLFSRAKGQRWAELSEARSMLADMPDVVRNALTTIGILGALGQSRGLRANDQQIMFALTDQVHDPDVRIALNLLTERRQVVFRQFRQRYVLWEGSDLDIDLLTQQTRTILGNQLSLVELLRQQGGQLPLIARRFSYRTGAVRTFTQHYVSADALPTSYQTPFAQGEILLVVAPDHSLLHIARVWATSPDRQNEPLRIVVIPSRPETLRDLLLEVAALQTILEKEPALEHDRSARREVAGRLTEVQRELELAIDDLYGIGQSEWYWCGESHTVRSTGDIDSILTQACEKALPDTPRIWNELIVRRQLSSAAAKARRNLIEAMLDHGHEALLGFQGYPPERAIYESVLRSTNIHHPTAEGHWEFGKPADHDPLHVGSVWQAIQQFIDSSEKQAQPIQDLYTLLEAPPYGVKAGLLPIFLMAVYLANAGHVALYEHDNYVPVPDIALFERMLRQPKYFAIRQSRVSGVRVAVLERLARALAPGASQKSGQPALLEAIRPLLRLVKRLPVYSRTTNHLSVQARAIRQTLLVSPAPDILLFESLPRACDLPPFALDQPIDNLHFEQFFRRLREGLEELTQAFSQLEKQVLDKIRTAFGSDAQSSTDLHEDLTTRYQRIASVTSDGQLRALGVRVMSTASTENWLASVAALIGRKPLEAWNDDDASTFSFQVVDLGRRFQLVEQIAVATQQFPPEAQVLRIGLADAHEERSMVVSRIALDPTAATLQQELKAVFDRYSLSRSEQVAVLAELFQSIIDETD